MNILAKQSYLLYGADNEPCGKNTPQEPKSEQRGFVTTSLEDLKYPHP